MLRLKLIIFSKIVLWHQQRQIIGVSAIDWLIIWKSGTNKHGEIYANNWYKSILFLVECTIISTSYSVDVIFFQMIHYTTYRQVFDIRRT